MGMTDLVAQICPISPIFCSPGFNNCVEGGVGVRGGWVGLVGCAG